jgi:hypothetical protein
MPVLQATFTSMMVYNLIYRLLKDKVLILFSIFLFPHSSIMGFFTSSFCVHIHTYTLHGGGTSVRWYTTWYVCVSVCLSVCLCLCL